MADTELNISPDEKVAGVPLARLLRNLDETSYNEGSVDLSCRLTDCKAVIEELLQQRALASCPAEVDGSPVNQACARVRSAEAELKAARKALVDVMTTAARTDE